MMTINISKAQFISLHFHTSIRHSDLILQFVLLLSLRFGGLTSEFSMYIFRVAGAPGGGGARTTFPPSPLPAASAAAAAAAPIGAGGA